ncbi:MAG: hypothetical protein WD066_05170 [Planctomycetaceae bacterium]
MEALKRTSNQFLELFGSMTPSQRGTLIVVPLLLAGAFAMLLFRETSTSSYVPLSWGKVFTTEELIHAEQTLREKGLGKFRREGAQILAPAGEAEQYNAALLANGGLPSQPLSEFEKQLDKRFSIWTGAAQLQAMKDIALEKEINRTLQAVNEIQSASVKWARSGGGGRFSRNDSRVTATVSVKPRPGSEVSSPLVRSLQGAVAAMIPDLRAQDVTVFDLGTGESHVRNDSSDPQGNEFLARTRQFQDEFRREVRSALSYIPEVLVTVKVDLDNLKSSVARQQLLDPKKSVPLRVIESTRTSSSNRGPSSTEPGQIPNQPRSLAPTGGNATAQSLSEQDTESLSAPSFEITEKELETAIPQAVQVSVAIPEDYYRAIAAQQAGGTEVAATSGTAAAPATGPVKTQADVERDVKATVAAVIGATEDKVTVTSYVRVDGEVPEFEPSTMDTVGELASQWGGAAGLGLFATWALWMVARGGSRSAKDAGGAAPSPAPAPFPPFDDDEEETPLPRAPEPTARDRLQVSVRDNPEMAAAVLSKWIQAAK